MKRKEKFTPGPWDYILRDGGTVIDVANRDRIAVVDLRMGVGNVDANTQLIAAAPELYDALFSLVGMLSGSHGVEDVPATINNARTALAKARGEA